MKRCAVEARHAKKDWHIVDEWQAEDRWAVVEQEAALTEWCRTMVLKELTTCEADRLRTMQEEAESEVPAERERADEEDEHSTSGGAHAIGGGGRSANGR